MTEAAQPAIVPWSWIMTVGKDHGHMMTAWPRWAIRDLRIAMGKAKIDCDALYSACFYIPGEGGGFRLIASTRVFDMASGAQKISTFPAMLNSIPSTITGKPKLSVVRDQPTEPSTPHSPNNNNT